MKLSLSTVVACLATLVITKAIGLRDSSIAGPEAQHDKHEVHVLRVDSSKKIPKTLIGSLTGGIDEYADDATWKRYTEKGGALVCAMRASDEDAGKMLEDKRNPPSAKSIWTGDLRQDLNKWYWHHVDSDDEFHCDYERFWLLANAFDALDLDPTSSAEGGDNYCYRIEHQDPSKKNDKGQSVRPADQTYTADGKEYRATNAYYAFGMNREGGAMMGQFLDGPKTAARDIWFRDAKTEELPALRSLSDVLWGFWNRDNGKIKNIRYYMVNRVANEIALQLMGRALKNKGKELEEWPGASFDVDTDEGHAILGSPIGATIAYFLMQHKAELGLRTVTKVTVLCDDSGGFEPHVIFHIDEVKG